MTITDFSLSVFSWWSPRLRLCVQGEMHGARMNERLPGRAEARERRWLRRQSVGRREVVTMKLLTRELERRFAAVGSQENVADPIVIAKFFNPIGAGTWFATEYDPEHRM